MLFMEISRDWSENVHYCRVQCLASLFVTDSASTLPLVLNASVTNSDARQWTSQRRKVGVVQKVHEKSSPAMDTEKRSSLYRCRFVTICGSTF